MRGKSGLARTSLGPVPDKGRVPLDKADGGGGSRALLLRVMDKRTFTTMDEALRIAESVSYEFVDERLAWRAEVAMRQNRLRPSKRHH